MSTQKHLLILLALLLALSACQKTAVSPNTPADNSPHIEIVAEGLLAPIGIVALPDGRFLIAEDGTGANDDSAGVSLMLADGSIGRLVSGFESGRDSGDLSGSPLVGLSPDGETVFIGNFGAGHLWALPVPAIPQTLPNEPYTPADLEQRMLPLNNVRMVNPFDITFSADGRPVITDSTGDGVAIENPDGSTHFFHRFDQLIDPTNEKLFISPVPTGIERIGDEYYVTLLGGCPFPDGGGELVAIDEKRNQRTVIDNLNMPIDVARGEDGTIWLLEFATFTPDASCFSGMGYQQNTGRLSRLLSDGDGGQTTETIIPELNFPGAVLPMPDGSLYITEVMSGHLLHITFGSQIADVEEDSIPVIAVTPAYREIEDVDEALTAVIARNNLHSHPGQELRQDVNPLTQLGEALFFDPIMSGDNNAACATCHHPSLAMADARVLPIGTGGAELGPLRDFVERVTLGADASEPRKHDGKLNAMSGEVTVANPFIGKFVPRNSPTILNSALLNVQFWDGRVQSDAMGEVVTTQEGAVNALELTDAVSTQALFPLTSLHEMSGATLGNLAPQEIRNQLITRLEAMPVYKEMFAAAFGDDSITTARIADALGTYEARYIFTDAAWDAYVDGDLDALTAQEKAGALLFFGERNTAVNCAQCHTGDLFTDLGYHNLLVPQLGPGKGVGDNGREDWGRSLISYDHRDQYAFRTPSLRNVALTAPYFHTGAYATLEATIAHHANIWESAANYDPSAHLPPAYYSSVRPFEPEKQGHSASPILRDGLPLTDSDIADLTAFLHALTDPAAMDLSAFVPESVPSGLPLDPLPDMEEVRAALDRGNQATAIAAEEEADPPPLGWQFVDGTADAALDFKNEVFTTATFEDPGAMMGSGVCWIDYDNDGWLDLYLLNSYAEEEMAYWDGWGGLPENGLFHNDGGQFEDVSIDSNSNLSMRGNGCLAADLNADGWTDLFLTADGTNALLWNNGDGTFSEGAMAAGVADPEWNSTAIAADLNHDGYMDIFVGSFIDLDYSVPRPTGAFPGDYYGLPNHLYLNNGDGTFTDVAKAVGLELDERALGSIFSDLDNDGDLDLYIANDGQSNRLYLYESDEENGIGFRFVDHTKEAEVGDTGSGMGVNSADYDNDGWFDLFVNNWEAELNAVYRNETGEEGFPNFRYSTYRIGMRGLGNNMTGWGVLLADFDHDMDVDLMTVNGRVPVTNWETDPELVRLYGNRWSDGFAGEFREWTPLAGLREVGTLVARGAAAADFDNDGDLDVVVNQIGGTAVILRNEGGNEQGNWLQFSFGSPAPAGALVTITLPDGSQLRRELHVGSSFHSTEDPRLHFGLGDAEVVDVEVWVNGRRSVMEGVAVNQVVVVEEG